MLTLSYLTSILRWSIKRRHRRCTNGSLRPNGSKLQQPFFDLVIRSALRRHVFQFCELHCLCSVTNALPRRHAAEVALRCHRQSACADGPLHANLVPAHVNWRHLVVELCVCPHLVWACLWTARWPIWPLVPIYFSASYFNRHWGKHH